MSIQCQSTKGRGQRSTDANYSPKRSQNCQADIQESDALALLVYMKKLYMRAGSTDDGWENTTAVDVISWSTESATTNDVIS